MVPCVRVTAGVFEMVRQMDAASASSPGGGEFNRGNHSCVALPRRRVWQARTAHFRAPFWAAGGACGGWAAAQACGSSTGRWWRRWRRRRSAAWRTSTPTPASRCVTAGVADAARLTPDGGGRVAGGAPDADGGACCARLLSHLIADEAVRQGGGRVPQQRVPPPAAHPVRHGAAAHPGRAALGLLGARSGAAPVQQLSLPQQVARLAQQALKP